jgi:hypothetical protein
MEHFYQSLGQDWFTYPGLYGWAVRHFGAPARFVEVGSWKGRSAAFMAVEIHNSRKSITLDCVDTWLGNEDHYRPGPFFEPMLEGQDALYLEFMRNIAPVSHIVRPVRAHSHLASSLYEDGSLDFVFLDADHSYEAVMRDIASWLPKVRAGGVLAGHDYGPRIGLEGVSRAVDESLAGQVIEFEDCWVHGVGFTPDPGALLR